MDWTEDRLRKILEDSLPETDEREYKSKGAFYRGMTDKELGEISKDVSAMANYPGGVIIFGFEEERDRAQKEKIAKEIVGYAPGEITQSWIEDKLEHLVTPRLPAYAVHQVAAGKDATVYVVEIPKSSSAPHQAKDFRYYRRKSSRSVPADHLEIEGIRHAGAPISLDIEFHRGSSQGDPPSRVEVRVVVRNTGVRPSKGLFAVVLTPISNGIDYLAEGYPEDIQTAPVERGGIKYKRFQWNFGGEEFVLFPGEGTKQFSVFEVASKNSNPLSPMDFEHHSVIFEIQTLDGFQKEVRKDYRDLMDELLGWVSKKPNEAKDGPAANTL